MSRAYGVVFLEYDEIEILNRFLLAREGDIRAPLFV